MATKKHNYLNREEAAEYIRTTYAIPCTRATLAKYACGYGTTAGPAYRKVSNKASLYTKKDLDAWAKMRFENPTHIARKHAT